MDIRVGDKFRLTNISIVGLSGCKIEVKTIFEDDEGTMLDVELLEQPMVGSYSIGDILTISPYHLSKEWKD